MKQKILIALGLVLILALIGFMVRDLFVGKADRSNPYEYDITGIRKGDTSAVQFKEVQTIKSALTEVHGIALDKSGAFYVAGKDGLEIYNPDGKLVSKFKLDGTANCIFVDNDKTIYLGMGNHIEKYAGNGVLVQKWEPTDPESVLTSIAKTGKSIFVADAGLKIVYRYDQEGKMQKRIGQKDPQTGVKGFIIPSPYFDLAIADNDHIWVVNPGRHELEKFTFDGDPVTSWGVASMATEGFCGCCNPSNFALMPDSSFVTSEKAIERVKIYSPKGEFVCLVAASDSFTEGTKGIDLAVNAKGEIYALDPERLEVRKFVKKNNQPN